MFLSVLNLWVIRNMSLILNSNRGTCFVFSIAPESYEELKSLLSGKSTEEQLLVVERIKTCNHPSLAVGNKAKLEVRVGHCGWQGSPALGQNADCPAVRLSASRP